MKQGQAVFLKFDPRFRGSISGVSRDEFWVTWHKPSVDEVPVENNDRRMKVRYSKSETKGIGFGVPA